MVATLPAPAARTAAKPASGWDTEVFVLRAADRESLRVRVLNLAAFLERHPETPLADLAFTLSADTGSTTVSLVSGSVADLQKKLNRAAERLADPNCKQIRDGNGVYFFSEPLAEQGTVAFLYPGEGAQYLDMLADLCRVFPEVERAFAWCDELAESVGRSHESLRRTLQPSPSATAEERAAAEAELRRLGPSIFGVLIADLALTDLLGNLQVPMSAVAGHSAGELAALLAAGILKSMEETGPKLVETMDLMQRLEDESGGPDVALLAVGAGKPAVEGIEATLHTKSTHIAMDNCPHQCVAVGPANEIAAIEAALTERGTICERLPFRRPYHTPLFEPWMKPFRDLFEQIPFEAGHTPAYCCSTGERFPADPAALRGLTVNHWVNPVEFTKMIERMHADGVRLFVEVGPRGNLSAFVEDILRGRPFTAIPANTTRKSGPTQINHLVAQLAAHGVPVNLGHLYANREVSRIEWEPQPVAAPGGLDSYFAVMEQFLDVQREVMESYLANSGRVGTAHQQLRGLSFDSGSVGRQCPPYEAEPAPAAPCLLGDIIEFAPAQSIVFRRTMDLREDLYVDDHTLGGRGVSRVDPHQNGLPVLPMTFSLEAMATAASQLAPGKVVTAIRNVRLYRWLPFDLEPTTLEVRAAVASVDPETGEVIVKANVRDLGNSFLPDGANKPSSEAVVVLADRWPDPPPPLPFQLTQEVRCKSTVEDLRRNMFHGPQFWMIRSLDRTGDEGIEGTLEVQPRDRWLASNPNPMTVIDPVLVDSAMHILGAWHLEQPDWSGRILLPIGVSDLEFYGPIPETGTMMLVRGHNEEETARQARHGVELFLPDGRLWFRMTGAAYWRFYLPFGDVNFFGPKDQYFLSRRLESAEPSADCRVYCLEPPLDLQQPVLRASGVCVTMTPREIAEHSTMPGNDAVKSDWFFKRLVSKDAVRGAVFLKYGTPLFPADIEAEPSEAGRYVCTPRANHFDKPYPHVAYAVAGGLVAAISAFTPKIGIAIVPLKKNATEADIRAAKAEAEKQATAQAGGGPVKMQTTRDKNNIVAAAIGSGS